MVFRLARLVPLVCLLPVALLACSDGPGAVHMQWDPGGGELWVFPDDAFTLDDPGSRTGLRVDVTPERVPEFQATPETFQAIFRDMSSLDGFGVTAGVTVRFDAAIDPASLWSGESTADQAAPIVLVVERPDGPAPWPYELTMTDEDHSVILEPMVPLPPATRAFVAVTDRVRTADGRDLVPSKTMAAVLRGKRVGEVAARVAPRMIAAADSFVALGGVASVDELVGVVVFTTQSLYEDALAIAADIGERDITPKGAITCTPETLWTRCEGFFTAVDYRGDNGFIEDINAPGDIDDSVTYDLPFTVWLPLERPGPYGGAALPVLIYGHGLGSGRSQGERLAEFAAPRGMATVAIDSLRHGEHPTVTAGSTLVRAMDFFGISVKDLTFEPLVMREQFRQSTYDKLQLVRMLSRGVDLDGDQVVDLDPQRISYLGVSLGGIMGPEFLALAPAVDAAVLVVPGGRVSSIVSDAEQFSLVIDFMRPEDATDGEVDRFFPILQTILERGDAAVWARHLLAAPADKPAGFPASTPHVLMGMVIDDDTVPNTTNRVLARSLGIPIVPPMRQEVGLIGVTRAAPVSGNLADGRTAGLLQFDRIRDGDGEMKPATHSNIGDSEVGAEAWFRFLDSHLVEGTPTIIDPYVELGLP